jgi:hypothetical protein
MILQNQNTHKLRVKTVRGAKNDRHERNRVRGTVIIINTVVTYLVSSSFIQRLIYVIRRRVLPSKGGVRTTPETLVCQAHVPPSIPFNPRLSLKSALIASPASQPQALKLFRARRFMFSIPPILQ